MKRRLFYVLSCTICLPLMTGCLGDNEKTDHPLTGRWEQARSTTFGLLPQKDSIHQVLTFHTDGGYAMTSELFDWNDSTGRWVPDGTFLGQGSYEMLAQNGAYFKTEETQTRGGLTTQQAQVTHYLISGDSLWLTKSAVLKGTSNDLVGKWTSILDSNKIDYRINKMMWSFELKPDGTFLSEMVRDSFTYVRTLNGFTVEDGGGDQFEFQGEIKDKTLFIQYLESQTGFRRITK